MTMFRNLTIEWILWLSFSVCRIYVLHQYCCLLLSCFFNEMIFSNILRAKYYIVNMLESCMIFNNSFFALGLHPVIYLANRWTFFWWSLWMPWKTAALTLVLNTSMLIPFPLWCSEIFAPINSNNDNDGNNDNDIIIIKPPHWNIMRLNR